MCIVKINEMIIISFIKTMTKESKQMAFCGGTEKNRLKWRKWSRFQILVQGRIKCFLDMFLFLQGCRSRSYSMLGFKMTTFGMITVSLD